MSLIKVGKTAPPFGLTAIDGKSYSLQEGLKNGPVLAAFFKVTCPTCQYTLPFLERLHQQLRAKEVQIWGVAQDGVKDSQRFARDYALTFPILIDDKPYRVSREYGLEYVPTLFLIEPDGAIAIESEGFAKRDLLAIQKSLTESLAAPLGELFSPRESVPEYKPG
ncbi:putative Alkyl hydroperoxide reductase/ Thiol specific antioxidant/ Mal allergen [Acidobacteriia bacterium SbA2]|nr:putative Alkyl hydroperoxide reductase/ Thiol specific antioxidant/ Mal allergen [Acidobacteriia bacterium SbA2]